MLIAKSLNEHRSRNTAHWENQKTLKNGEGCVRDRTVSAALESYKIMA